MRRLLDWLLGRRRRDTEDLLWKALQRIVFLEELLEEADRDLKALRREAQADVEHALKRAKDAEVAQLAAEARAKDFEERAAFLRDMVERAEQVAWYWCERSAKVERVYLGWEPRCECGHSAVFHNLDLGCQHLTPVCDEHRLVRHDRCACRRGAKSGWDGAIVEFDE